MIIIKGLTLWLVTATLWLAGLPEGAAAPFTEVNWALAGTATQSSDLGGGVAERAIDGNTDGNWANNSVTHTTNTDDPAWWEVDLGATKPIGAISVWPRNDCCLNRNDDFTLIVYDANLTEIFRQTYPGRPLNNAHFNFAPPLQGKVVRIEAQNPRTTSDGYLALAEVEVIAPYENVPINITQPPSDTTIAENQAATFGPVAATIGDAPQRRLTTQWQKNGVDIPFATGTNYTTAPQTLADSGSEYSVKFLLPGLALVSPKAKLTVSTDVGVPRVDSIGFAGRENLLLSVNYNKLMDPTTSTNLSNYILGGGASIVRATLSGPLTNANKQIFNAVILDVLGLAPNTNYSLTVSGVKDLTGNTIISTNLSGSVPFFEINYARAPVAVATQSSDIDERQPAHLALDGNTEGVWRGNNLTHTKNTDDPPWWEVDLGSSKTIGRVGVWMRNDCCFGRTDDITVIILDANRAEVLRRQYPGRPPGSVFSFNFDPPYQGQIVRIEGQTPRTTSDGYLSLAEVEVVEPYKNVTLTVAQSPADVSVFENTTATLGPVTAQVVGGPEDKVTYQWQRNGVDIPGAIGATYTTPLLPLADNGVEYSARVFLSGMSALSARAKVTVNKDVVAPKVVSVDSVAANGQAKFFVTYNELMDPVTSVVPGNYAFGAGVTVGEVVFEPEGTSVVLTADGFGASPTYSLTVAGVKDLAGNTIASTTVAGSLQLNYAMTGSPSQSSDAGGATAERAIDGNTDGTWTNNSVTHTGNLEDPAFWEVDLGASKQIGQVHLWFRTDCCVNRNDDITMIVLGTDRTEIARRKYPGRPPSHVAFNFAPAISGQYVRVEAQTPRTTSDGYLALAEVQVFTPYPADTLKIAQGPVNQTAVEKSTATFGPVTIEESIAVPPSKLTFQWQKNGVDIPGAFGSSYTTPALTLADNGAQYSVRVLLPGLSATANATLTVTPETSTGLVTLEIASVGGIRITWPVSAAGYVLEAAGSLLTPAWQPATDPVTVIGDKNSVTPSNPVGTRFYRLIKR